MPMSQPAANPKSRHPITWAVITVLLLAALVGTLWVPFYARSTPKIGAFPFFYWYQLLWVPIVAVLSWVCYLLARSAKRADEVGHRAEYSRFNGGDGEASR
jgi:membrane protein implicated in regulation of membrane protease activity